MRQKLLIVDDDLTSLNNLKKSLNLIFENIIIDTASSYEEALKLIFKNNYDIALVDLNLSLENKSEGFLLIDKVLKKSFYSRVIIITGYDSNENGISCSQKEFSTIFRLIKPTWHNGIKSNADLRSRNI